MRCHWPSRQARLPTAHWHSSSHLATLGPCHCNPRLTDLYRTIIQIISYGDKVLSCSAFNFTCNATLTRQALHRRANKPCIQAIFNLLNCSCYDSSPIPMLKACLYTRENRLHSLQANHIPGLGDTRTFIALVIVAATWLAK